MEYKTKSLAMEQRISELRAKGDLTEAEQKELMELPKKYTRQRQIDDLRLFVNYMDIHPDIPMPYVHTLTAYCDIYDESYVLQEERTKKFMRNVVLELKRTFGFVKKVHSGSYFGWTVTFGDGLRVEWKCSRKSVCEARVVGTKEVPEVVIPASTEDVIEWDCKDPVLAD